MARLPSEKREKRPRRWLTLPESMWSEIDARAKADDREDYNDMVRVVLLRWLEKREPTLTMTHPKSEFPNAERALKHLAAEARSMGMKVEIIDRRGQLSLKAEPAGKGTPEPR